MIRIKRVCDVIGSIVCIIILSPLMLLIAVATKLTVHGSVIFTQKRVGYLQKEFEIFKFRTMAEGSAQSVNGGDDETGAGISGIGCFLRKTKLDELPQLFNVLMGDMSFVGPRPYIRAESEGLNPERYLVRPGLTGLGQVNGNRELDWEERTAYDVEYVRRCSLRLDMEILLKTVLVIILGEQAFLKDHKPLTWNHFHWYLADIKPLTVHDADSPRRKKPARNRYRGADNDIALEAETGHGKVTDCGNDRFRCIYTRIPADRDFHFEAEVTVTSFLHEPGPNHRESFGIFARDTMDPDPYTGEYYSNMAAVGGYYGRFNFFGRDGVRPDDIENVRNFFLYPMLGESRNLPESDRLHYMIGPDRQIRMRLSLKKDGGRITARMTDTDGGDLLSPSVNGGIGETAGGGRVLCGEDGYSVMLPGAFSSRDKAWIYIGFEAADGSRLSVHKDTVRIALTKAAEAVFPDETPASGADPKKDDRRRDAAAPPAADAPAPVRHDDSTGMTWVVTADGAPDGAGTELSPMNLRTAVRRCLPGDTVLVKAGRYLLDSSVCIERADPGRGGRMRTLRGEIGHTVFDFQGTASALIVRGDNWVIDGVGVTRGYGIKIEGNHNVIRNCRAYRNLETGILIRHPDISSPVEEWPAGNVVEDCVSFENRDLSECNADGFACKVAAGQGNCFRNCVSWLNADDGFDLFTKNRAIGAVSIERCQSYMNGYRIDENGTLAEGAGNGNGFKLGGSGLAVRHVVKDCTAAGNKCDGFTSNSNPIMVLERCTAYQNAHKNCFYYFYAAVKARPEKIIRDCSFAGGTEFAAKELLEQLRDRYER